MGRWCGRAWRVAWAALVVVGLAASGRAAESWQAGFAKVVITPEVPMWMSGYGSRDHAAEGKVQDLYARVAALRDPSGHTAVVVGLDLVGVPATMARRLSGEVEQKHGLKRADLMLTCSHTHCGPALDDMLSHMLAMTEADWQQVRAYQKQLDQKVLSAIDAALDDLRPAQLEAGQGACGFATNRRAPAGFGPTDHTVPVLRIASADGKTLRGIIYGYACHNTTLGFYQWCGDYAGFASLTLEDRHPETVALFFTGCGADQNPLPRRSLELCEQYGRTLAVSVDEVLARPMTPIRDSLKTAFRTIDLDFHALPTREQLEAEAAGGNRFLKARAELLLRQLDDKGSLSKSYPYPVQVWQLGDQITWIALGGEVVVDYALRLKRELGPTRTWVTGYANDVMAYIPSERVLAEGGYEGETAMIYYQMPSKWATGLEEKIVRTVHALIQELNAER